MKTLYRTGSGGTLTYDAEPPRRRDRRLRSRRVCVCVPMAHDPICQLVSALCAWVGATVRVIYCVIALGWEYPRLALVLLFLGKLCGW